LLYGDEEIDRGTESEMKKRRQEQKHYATAERPVRVVRASTLKRPIEDVIDLAEEEFRDSAKRLRLQQDAEYATGLAEDQEKERRRREHQEWKDHYGNPENRAIGFDKLFKAKNDRFKACLERVKM